MKKFLGIVFLGLLWCEISFSKETKLTCEYIETYYRNWDNNQFGDTIKDETATKSAYFNIIKGLNNTYGFETNMYLPNLRVVEDEKFISKVDDNNYLFYALKDTTYVSIEINRFNGSLTTTTGHTNDDSKYLIQNFYNCKKGEQKF